jgi:hypothetical protein
MRSFVALSDTDKEKVLFAINACKIATAPTLIANPFLAQQLADIQRDITGSAKKRRKKSTAPADVPVE